MSTAQYGGCREGGRPPVSRGRTTASATAESPRPAPTSSKPCAATSPVARAAWRCCAATSTIRTPRRAAGATSAPGRGTRRRCPSRRAPPRRDAIDRPGVDLEARTQWPTGMAALGVDVKGKIPADEQMADGRAVARLSDIGWGTRLRELVGPGAADDAPVTPAVVNAVVAVLKTWGGSTARWPSWRCRHGRGRSSSPRSPSASPRSGSSTTAGVAGLRPRRPDRWTRRQQRSPPRRGVGACGRPARRCGGGGAAARAGAPHRRRRRFPLDAHRRRPRAAPSRRDRGAPPRAGPRRLTRPSSSWRSASQHKSPGTCAVTQNDFRGSGARARGRCERCASSAHRSPASPQAGRRAA